VRNQDDEVKNVLFVSYASEDHNTCSQIVPYLSHWANRLGYEVWWDQFQRPGRPWNDQIGARLARAKAAIVLVSIDALNSNFIWEREIQPLLESGVPVAPLLVRPCPWQVNDVLNELQFLDPPGTQTGLNELSLHDQEWVITAISKDLATWLPVVENDQKGGRWGEAQQREPIDNLPKLIQGVPHTVPSLPAEYEPRSELREDFRTNLLGGESGTVGITTPPRAELHGGAGVGNGGTRVFLCHASQDKQLTRELCEQLLGEGYDVWLDERNLLPGQDWDREIRLAVRESDAIIVLVSHHSVNKIGYVQQELRLVLDAANERPEGSIFLVPLLLDDAPIPSRLSKWHWLDTKRDGWFDRLLMSLNYVTRSARRQDVESSALPRSAPVSVDFLSLDSSLTEAAPGQVIGLGYRIRLWSDQALHAVLGASLVSRDGKEYFDVTKDRDVDLVPGEAIYRRQLQVPSATASGTYRLIGGIWTPRIGERRLATLDLGFIITIAASRQG